MSSLGGKALAKLRAQFDWPLAVGTSAILVIGLVNLYSATRVAPGKLYSQQLTWLGFGLVAFVVVAAIDYRLFERLAPILYVACVVLLLAVLVFGRSVKGSKRWLGIANVGIQPSEMVKIGVILMLAKLGSDEPVELRRRGLPTIFTMLGVLLVPVVVIFLEPDLGTSLLLYIIGFSMILLTPFWWGHKLTAFLIAPLIALMRLSFGLKLYQKKRLMTFIDPSSDPLGAGFHARQSVYAIGSGRWTGKGWLHGTQNQLQFLPEHWTDFPFAVWAEEWGLLGSLALLGCYLFLILWALGVSATARDRFGQLLALGVACLLFWHVVINIGMVTGVMPVVGVTLPLVSYGGSSLMTVLIALGLLMNVSIRRYSY
ncbi:MAG: rod shape-determining protein RodA [Myxococcales bacterium]|nr:rod shape-determining protein RodA [Myxococcales bacterium]